MMNNTQSAPISHFVKLSTFRQLLKRRRQIRALSDVELTKLYLSKHLNEVTQCMVSSEWDKRDWLWRS
jgi:hypothetical protein